MDPAVKILQLTEALRVLLEGEGSEKQQDSLRGQVSTDTANVILKWLEREEVSASSLTSEGTQHSDGDRWQTVALYDGGNILNPIYPVWVLLVA